jgi:hypothetical protein
LEKLAVLSLLVMPSVPTPRSESSQGNEVGHAPDTNPPRTLCAAVQS